MLNKKPIVEKYKVHHTDTGSPEVQVALLTGRINLLTEHFKKFPKDFTSRHGFLKLIGQRRRLLEYLKQHSKEKYQDLIKQLELRK